MRKGIVIVIIGLFIGAGVIPAISININQYQLKDYIKLNKIKTSNLNDGLVAYWSFDDENNFVHDDSGNGFDCINHGSTWVTDGFLNGAVSFNGSDNYMNTPIISEINNEFTLSFCIKTSTLGKNMVVIEKDIIGTGTTDWSVLVFNTGKICLIQGMYGTNYYTFSNKIVNDNIWHHIIITRSTTAEVNVYIDGELDVYHDLPAGSISNSEIIRFGCWDDPGGFGGLYNGLMDEVRIYNRALSEGEIEDLYEIYQTKYYVAFIPDYDRENIYLAEIGTPENWIYPISPQSLDICFNGLLPDEIEKYYGNLDVCVSENNIIKIAFPVRCNKKEPWSIAIGDLNLEEYNVEVIEFIPGSLDDDTRDEDPKFSWNASKIVFKRNNDIYIWNMTSGDAPWPLTETDNEEWGPVFNADGDKIVFTRSPKNKKKIDIFAEIIILNCSNKEETQITNNKVPDWYPTFLKNGKIVFSRYITWKGYFDDLYIKDLTVPGEADELYSVWLSSEADPYPLKDQDNYFVFLKKGIFEESYNLYLYDFQIDDAIQLSNNIEILGPSVFKH